jgi:hypothetical protein
LKKDNSNNFYLFGNSNTLPTPVGWVPEQSGNLYINSAFIGTDNNILNPSKLTIRSQGGNQSALDISCPINQIERLTIWRGINDIEVGSFSKDGEFTCNRIGTSILSAGAPVTFGNVVGPGNYTFPEFRGTDQQIMKLDNSGVLSFEYNNILRSPDGLSTITMNNDLLSAVVSDGVDTIEAIDVVHDITNIRGGSSELRLTDRPAGVRITRAGIIRLSMTTDDTSLFNGNNNSRLQIFDKSCQISTEDTSNIEQTRVLVDASQSLFNSPDGTQKLLLTDSTFQLSSALTTYITATSNTVLGVSQGVVRSQISTSSTDLVAPNGTTKLQVFNDRIETNIKISSPDMVTDFIDALAANPLQIGAITAASVNIGKSGSDTVIEGGLVVKESLELGVAPNNYSVPVVKGLDKQFLQADANGDLQYGYHEFYASLQAENNFNLTLTNINQYYVPLNATIPFNSLDFSQSPPAGFTYNGTNSRIVKAEFHVAVEQVSAGSGNTINIRILVNNVPQSGRMRAKIDNTAPYPVEVSLSTCFLVSNGDIISGAIECETTSGLVIDIFSYSLVLTKT